MKKIAILTSLLAIGFLSHAQYDNIKNKLLIPTMKSIEDAKADVDKRMTNTKFASRAEAYILKATIYSYLAADSSYKASGKADPLQAEAEAAFAKYLEMDPSQEQVKDPVYRNSAINLYSNLFDKGYEYYQDKKYAEAFTKFEKVSEYSELLGKNQLLSSMVDTNTLILAAYTAEMSDQKDEAAKYYKKLGDAKVSGENYESVYRFLVTYHFQKKNMDEFEKYKALGAQLYPKSEYFTYDKVDFAVGLETDFDAKIAALDEQLKVDPNHYKANMSMVELAFEALHSEKEDAPKPKDPAALEQKMLTSLDRLAQIKPEEELSYLIKGDHYINLSVAADKKREEHAADMKKRTKPGTSASKEDIAKRDQLDTEYAELFDKAREPYEKACDLFAKRSDLSNSDKQQYKKAAGYLGDIYTMKAARSKNNAADRAKYDALAKKWNDLYGSIR